MYVQICGSICLMQRRYFLYWTWWWSQAYNENARRMMENPMQAAMPCRLQLHHQRIQQTRPLAKSKSWENRMATQSTHVSSHISPYGCSLLDRQENLRTRTWRPHGWLGREHGFWSIFLNTTLSGNISSRTRLWGKFTIREDSSLEKCGTIIQWKWKTDQWTNRNHWCKHY